MSTIQYVITPDKIYVKIETKDIYIIILNDDACPKVFARKLADMTKERVITPELAFRIFDDVYKFTNSIGGLI